MTEAVWLASTKPDEMLVFLQGKASDRKLRLFGCACVRRVWYRLEHYRAARHAVEIAEEFADGQRTLGELEELSELSREGELAEWVPTRTKESRALRAVGWCVLGDFHGWEHGWEGHPGIVARHAAGASGTMGSERVAQAQLLRDVFGNPFRPATVDPAWLRWNDCTVPKIAAGIYEERAFDRLPILHDALLDAGCDDEDILAHCRGAGPHVRGCWVIDLILGKE
jgi:hypothetical protein